MTIKRSSLIAMGVENETTAIFNELLEDEDFNKLLLDECIITIKNALNRNRKSTRIFYVPNIECSVVLEKHNFGKVLDTAITFYEDQEDYVKCAELVKLKEEVNESKKANKANNRKNLRSKWYYQ